MEPLPKGRGLLVRATAEFTVIVLGVLVALQLESWTGARVDRTREREQIEALRADLAASITTLGFTIALQRQAVAAAEELLSQYGPDGTTLPLDSIARLYPIAITWYASETVTGAYDALIGSGDIGLLSSPELRRQLAEFYGLVSIGFEDHANELDVLDQLLQESGGQIRRLMAPDGRVLLPPERPSDVEARAVEELLANESFAGLLTWKSVLGKSRLDFLLDLSARADELLLLVDP
jgi:hypothetical protein